MTHVILIGCIECGRCKRQCPEKAIYKGPGRNVINAIKCTDCLCCVDECLLERIIPDFEYEPQ